MLSKEEEKWKLILIVGDAKLKKTSNKRQNIKSKKLDKKPRLND